MTGEVIVECRYMFVSFVYKLNVYFIHTPSFSSSNLWYHKPVRNLSPYVRRFPVHENTRFQQDRATSLTARVTMNLLKDLFPNRLISRNGDVQWPPRSPDLSSCDYFL
jgi:hypothetical protein